MKEYVLFHDPRGNQHRYWYGSYAKNSELWSTWVYSIKEAVEHAMVKVGMSSSTTSTIDTYIQDNKNVEMMYRGTVPLTMATHPEYFI